MFWQAGRTLPVAVSRSIALNDDEGLPSSNVPERLIDQCDSKANDEYGAISKLVEAVVCGQSAEFDCLVVRFPFSACATSFVNTPNSALQHKDLAKCAVTRDRRSEARW